MCECECETWARVPGEAGTDPMLPVSEHHPECEAYKAETFFRVRLGGGGCAPFICERADLSDMLEGETEPALVEPVKMARDQFDRLQDFAGP